MGYSTILDILASSVIGGMLMLLLLRANDTAVENSFVYAGELVVQQNLISTVQQVEHDFRRIGYCADWTQIPNPTLAIIEATPDKITFLTDLPLGVNHPEGDGVVDVLTYYVGNTSELKNTPNPNDRLLYWQVNNDAPLSASLGITQFQMVYFNEAGDTIKNMPSVPPLGIITMEINITVENPAAYGDTYEAERKAVWRQIRLAARNIKNR